MQLGGARSKESRTVHTIEVGITVVEVTEKKLIDVIWPWLKSGRKQKSGKRMEARGKKKLGKKPEGEAREEMD